MHEHTYYRELHSTAVFPRMNRREQDLFHALGDIRRQLALSQEDLARQLGVSFATVNRWENGHSRPSKLALAQLTVFCDRMIAQGKLAIAEESRT